VTPRVWLTLEELSEIARQEDDSTDLLRIRRLAIEVFELRGLLEKAVKLVEIPWDVDAETQEGFLAECAEVFQGKPHPRLDHRGRVVPQSEPPSMLP